MSGQGNSQPGAALALAVPPALVDALTEAVRDKLEADGLLGRTTPELLTTGEAAAYLRCGRQRIFDLTSQGRLRVAKDGSRNLYRREWLEAYVEGRPS